MNIYSIHHHYILSQNRLNVEWYEYRFVVNNINSSLNSIYVF